MRAGLLEIKHENINCLDSATTEHISQSLLTTFDVDGLIGG